MLGQSLELYIGQRQTLTMTPELITALQILQYDAQELEAYIDEQLLTNPVLEAGDAAGSGSGATSGAGADSERGSGENANDGAGPGLDGAFPDGPEIEKPSLEKDSGAEARTDSDYLTELLNDKGYDDISYSHMSPRNPDEAGADEIIDRYGSADNDISLTEYLMFQLHLTDLSVRRKEVGSYIIESLEPSGYLLRSSADIAEALGVGCAKVDEVISVIQGFDPPGIAARDLSECILIQLRAQGIEDKNILLIAERHIPNLAANRIAAIAQSLSIPAGKVQEAADLIRSLEPKPGIAFGRTSGNTYIVPDVIVEEGENGYFAYLNDSRIPHLFISPYYRRLMRRHGEDEQIVGYLRTQMGKAVNLIRNIERRNKTISLVVDAILARQSDYLRKGEGALKPMTLRDIAGDVGIHESTVSRSINGKYMQTPRGVIEIKRLFSGKIGGAGGAFSGSETTRENIKARIKKLVNDEDPAHPLSDQAITDIISAEGVDISRRAVAKYRDELNIASSSRRRRY
jgi:RNA polymerase sigma-54 factor